MDKPKIGIFVESFPSVSETFVFQKVNTLLEHGYDIQIFTLKPSEDWNKLKGKSINTNNLKSRVHCANVNTLIYKKLFQLIRQFIFHPLVVLRWIIFNVFFSENDYISTLDKILNRLNFVGTKLNILSIEFDTLGYKVVDLKSYLKCKIVVNTRGVAQSTNTFRRQPKILLLLNRYADYVCFASAFLKKNSYKLGLSPDIPSKIIYGSVSEEFFNTVYRAKSFKKSIKLLSVGRLAWSKGYEFNIDAINKLVVEGYNVSYKIIGEGPHKDAILNSLDFYGLVKSGVVTLTGTKNPSQIKNCLLESDIFIQGSVAEGFGISVLEAQFVGMPIVCSDAGGLPENISANVTGLIFRRRDSKDMKEKIKTLIENQELANKIGHSAFLVSRTRYNPQKETAEIENVFKKLL